MPHYPFLASQPLMDAVDTQFSSRPTLDSVALHLLTSEIARTYPSLSIDLTRTQLLTPTSPGDLSQQPLMPRVLNFLANGTALDFSDQYGRRCQLSDHPPTPLTLAGAEPLDMQAIQALIETLPKTLPTALQNALAAHWNEASDSRVSRWQWLSEVLRDTLHMTVIQENDLVQQEREMLMQLINYPDLDQRIARYGDAAVHAYHPMATYRVGKHAHQRLGPDLMLVPVIDGKPRVLWCSLAGGYKRYDSMDSALEYWAHWQERDGVIERITTQRFETDGHLFDTQAVVVLNRQLQELHNLKLGAESDIHDFDVLKALCTQIADPCMSFNHAALYTSATLVALRRDLPDWLSQATPAERMQYRHYSLKLASAKKCSEGLTFLSNLPDIRTYTQTALLNQMQLDELRFGNFRQGQSPTATLQPDDLQLTFHVGANDGENVHMSLTDLVINNLCGKPRGQLTIAHRDEQPLPAWLTADYLLGSAGLIQQVDIGKTYPEMLKARLLGDSDEVRQREQRFAAQTVAHLPLLALESSLRQANGFTAAGAACVAALVGSHAGARQIDGQTIVIRQLALVRQPQAAADVVANMYIIEPENSQAGPHILYRPLYSNALLQFDSRAQLLEAIAAPGELQTSVLTWLCEDAPAPAALSEDGASDELQRFLASGQLMQFLYRANVRALVDQAERESVASAERRWRVFFEEPGPLFGNLLLPLARGPLMLTAWLLSLSSSASSQIPALNSQDPVTRELAWVDLLLNVGMLMFALVPTWSTEKMRLPKEAKWQALHSPLQRRVAGQWPPYPAADIDHGPILLGGGSSGLVSSVCDFSFASARQRLTADQRQRLWGFQAPKPDVLPAPVTSGAHHGLYNHLRDWYALIDTRWYQLRLEAGSVVIVDPLNTQRYGPCLQSDGLGNWSLDLRLRLRGGTPSKRMATARERKQHLINAQVNFIGSQQQALQIKVDTAQQLMSRTASDPKRSDADRANTRKHFDDALHEQINAYAALLDSRKERDELGIPMPVNVQVAFLENSVGVARKSAAVADTDRQALFAQNPDLSVPYEQALPSILLNQPRYAQFLKDMYPINERQIAALELRDRYLLELLNLDDPGMEAYTRLTLNGPDEPSVLSLKYLQMQNLKYLSKKNWRPGLYPHELDLALDPLGSHLRTHSELNQLDLYVRDDLALLDSLFQRYGQAVEALQALTTTQAGDLDGAYFKPLQALLASLYQEIVYQWAQRILPTTGYSQQRPKRQLTEPGKPQKKVIKTRIHGVLIGDVKPAGSASPTEVVEVRTEQSDQLLAAYSEHEGVWEEVSEQRRIAPSVATTTRALNVVNSEAHKRIKALQTVIQRQEGYARVSRFPIGLQESLEAEAARFTALADELERALAAQAENQQVDADRNLATQLRTASTTLIAKGLELRIQRTLTMLPTGSHVAYLLDQDTIQLASLGPRVTLYGERLDFIQEYVVNDKNGAPLWYAHFHYDKADTPKIDYSLAHLKSPAQRTRNYYSLLFQAESPQHLVDLDRGLISRELAQRWFLPLAT